MDHDTDPLQVKDDNTALMGVFITIVVGIVGLVVVLGWQVP